MFYFIQPVVNIYEKKGILVWTRQLPSFYLNGDIQGIVSVEHAEKIARAIINPTGNINIKVHPNVTEVEKIL